MAPQKQLERNAWQWAEETDPSKVTLENVLTAYRCSVPQCPSVPCICRKNCKGNPNCYNYLGEKMWIEKSIEEDLKDALIETANGMREPGTFIGLKNLGATCYANTFLQVWFHNPEFRRGILDLTDNKGGPLNSVTERADDGSLLPPQTVLGHLQLIFALLSFSDRQFIDPSPFIECLQLDTTLQQDAQEFSKLFISLIEDQLPAKACYNGLNLIQHQFVGRYEYVTRCSGCHLQSRSDSKFYEIDLNIKGHSNLDECLKEFLQEEKLDGENQYFCQYCVKKQDAVRKIHLLDLPPTLNFQLLRFIFDRQSQNKKKLMSYLQFPQSLDMQPYMNLPDDAPKREDLVYELVSVLNHRGAGAHSGHYVALIKDENTQATYTFNDEEVEKLADDKFRIETENDTDESKGSKKPKSTKGLLNSPTAYMLVYRRKSSSADVCTPEITLQDLSPYLQEYVETDNRKHDDNLKEQLETKRYYIGKDEEKQEMVRKFWKILQENRVLERDDSFEWVSEDWLRKWLAAECMGTVGPVNNSPLICPHEKVHPDNVILAKLLHNSAADLIFEKFGGSLRLPCRSSMCHQCIDERCRIIHTKAVLAEDNRLVNLMLKSTFVEETDSCYWVGKTSLRKWRQKAENNIEPPLPTENVELHENEPENGGKDSTANASPKPNNVTFSPSCTSVEASVGESGDTAGTRSADTDIAATTEEVDMEEEENWVFNEDLLCSHGKLSPDASTRRLVPQDIWLMLKKYFPNTQGFNLQSPVCDCCKTQDEQEKFCKEQDKVVATEQRQKLIDLFQEKKRPNLSSPDVMQVNILSREFLEDWRKFIREPLKHPIISNINNISLLCNHGLFMYDVKQCEALNERYEFVWPIEWSILMNYGKCDVEITVSRNSDGQGISIAPGFCDQCCHERQQVEYSLRFTYTNEKIYIRKVTDETQHLFALTLNASKSPTAAATASDGEGQTDDAADDQEFVNENGKRKHANGGSADKVQRVEAPTLAPVRRSTRKGRVHDEHKLDVSSTLTLRDLKMQLVKAFSVMKLDQHLFFDGIELTDESMTLEQLRIPPESILYLQADEPSGETTFMDVSPVNSVEEGFKGTTLVGR